MKFISGLLLLVCLWNTCLNAQDDERGKYFARKNYDGKSIPLFAESKKLLPQPVMQTDSQWLSMYWKTWELGFAHFKKPPEGSALVSNILDEAFRPTIYQWDMCFMEMFGIYANHIFPCIQSLDNFYCRQHNNGYICRELWESTGNDFAYMGRKNTINPPLFAWAEINSFKQTGDTNRLKLVLPVIEKYAEWLELDGSKGSGWLNQGRKAKGSVHGLYWNTGFGSGMDNSPRKGTGWVDMSCQMVMQYNYLAEMAGVLNLTEKENEFKAKAKDISDRINKYCWNETDGLYYDVNNSGKQKKRKTIACFWPMMAGVASDTQTARLIINLKDSTTFWRKFIFPSLAANEALYAGKKGGYWHGSVWAPTNFMIIKGLEKYGQEEFARQCSQKFLEGLYEVYKTTGTVWENYSPDYFTPGTPARDKFVGWTGIGPITLLIENILGFRLEGNKNQLTWHISRTDEHGIKNLRLGSATISAVCLKRKNNEAPCQIHLKSDKPFKLLVIRSGREQIFEVKEGESLITAF